MGRSAVWCVAGCVAGMVGLMAEAVLAEGPALPGWERLEPSGQVGDAELGRVLLGELSCVSCHAVDEGAGLQGRGGPALGEVGARVTANYLRDFLSEPDAVKPGTAMPHVLGEMEEGERGEAVEALTHFLVSQGGPIEPSAVAASEAQIEAGRRLYESVGCASCHAAEGVEAAFSSIPLGPLAKKTTVEELAAFLRDPHATRPSGRMPSLDLTEGEAKRIALYLLRDQAEEAFEGEQVARPGLDFAYYEASLTAEPATFEAIEEPTRAGKIERFSIDIDGRRGDQFGFRYRGMIDIPRDGRWTFATVSDDGSKLWVNGQLVVDNGGVHGAQERTGAVELKAGMHEIELTYFERAGGQELAVYWEGPGQDRQEIPADVLYRMTTQPMQPVDHEPLEVDPSLAQRGREIFRSAGCVSCHEGTGVEPADAAAPALAELMNADGGCLSASPEGGPADFGLSERQRETLAAALAAMEQTTEPLPAEREVTHALAGLNCYGCHERDDIGGPEEARAALFETLSPVDMGEEGRIPPPLDDVGAKLRGEALERILYEGELHVRPHMATRMPLFGRENLEGLVAALREVDEVEPQWAEPTFSDEAAEAGRQLAGVEGLGCVTCHTAAGYDSLGIPGVDLAVMHERLDLQWFRRFMQNPAAVREGTRMPSFWQNGQVIHRDVADGTMEGQIDALWAYLSLGDSIPLPAGLDAAGGDQYVLVPSDEPILHRTFMADVGPRAIAVGYPERVHVAFDANQVRLAQVWRGDFFSAEGMWAGRGGELLGPLGTDVLALPAGPAVAVLGSLDEPWPRGGERDRDVGGTFSGYRLDEQGRPTFRYEAAEGVKVAEQPIPVPRPGGSRLLRRFAVTAEGEGRTAYLLALRGAAIEQEEGGAYVSEDGVRVELRDGEGATVPAVMREGEDGATEVLVAVDLEAGQTRQIEVELAW